MFLRTIRASVLLSGAALILASATLQASTRVTEKFEIPFSFKAQKRSLPAGQYQIQENTELKIAFLVNAKTGERVATLHPRFPGQIGQAHLVFESEGNELVLKKIS